MGRMQRTQRMSKNEMQGQLEGEVFELASIVHLRGVSTTQISALVERG